MVVDRIENGIAVIENEDGTHIEVKCAVLPMSIREGDAVKLENGRYVIDYDMTDKYRADSKNLLKKLREKSK